MRVPSRAGSPGPFAPGLALRLRAKRGHSGNVLLAGGSPGAGNGVIVSKSKSLNLAFNVLPRLGRPLEEDSITSLKVRPQLVVAQKPSIYVFHR